MDIQKLKENCIKSAIEHGKAAYEVVENSNKTNRLFKKNRENFKELKLHEHGIDALYELLQHENYYVSFNAALFLLSIDEKLARKTIDSIPKNIKLFNIVVQYSLEEIDKGTIQDYYL